MKEMFTNTNVPLPVEKLTLEQETLMTYRFALEEQVKKLEDYKTALSILQRHTCKHEVIHDYPGQPYDSRYCVICGSFLGIL